EGREIIDHLTNSPEQRASFIHHIKEEALHERLRKTKMGAQEAATGEGPVEVLSSSIRSGVPIPTPPFWGPRLLERIGIEDVAACMDLNTLYRLHWGGKAPGADFPLLVEEESPPRLDRMLLEARQQRYLQPRVIYGYFPCQSSGNELIVYDPQNEGRGRREVTRFRFPRQKERERLCLADYFAPVESDRIDVVAFQ